MNTHSCFDYLHKNFYHTNITLFTCMKINGDTQNKMHHHPLQLVWGKLILNYLTTVSTE